MKRIKILFICLVIVTISLGSFLFILNRADIVQEEATSQLETLKIGYLAVGTDLSFFVALDQNFFQKYGLLIEPIKFESSNQEIDALISGRIDGTSLMALLVLLSVEERYPNKFKIFEMGAAEKDSTIHRIIAGKNSDINKLSDLEGKTIGTYPGSAMSLYLKLMLGKYMDISKVDIRQLAPPLQVQALASGQVDALFTLEPIGTIAESKNISKSISVNILYKELLKPFPTVGSVFSQEFISKHPAIVQRYISAIEDAHRFIELNEKEAKKSLAGYTKISPEIIDKVGIYSYWSKDEINLDAVNKVIDLYVDNNILQRKVSAEEIILS